MELFAILAATFLGLAAAASQAGEVVSDYRKEKEAIRQRQDAARRSEEIRMVRERIRQIEAAPRTDASEQQLDLLELQERILLANEVEVPVDQVNRLLR